MHESLPLPLSQAFLAQGAQQLRVDAEPVALEKQLAELCVLGATAWQNIPLDRIRFVKYLAERVQERTDVPDVLSHLHIQDLYLACACLQGLPQALDAFERSVLSQVPLFLAKIDSSSAFVDEVRQTVRERLFVANSESIAKIAEYVGRGSLVNWVRIVAVRCALNLRRGHREQPAESIDSALTTRVKPGPESELVKLQCQQAFKEAFQSAFVTLTLQQRNVLRLHYISELSCERIGSLLQVHRNTVSRWLDSACTALLLETQRLLQQRLRVPASEVDSLIRMARSQLGLSITALLQELP